MVNDTFSHYLVNVIYAYSSNPDWRYGQTCFNVLYQLDEDLANSIRGTEIDPFYNDNRLPEFLTRLRNEWNAE